MMLAYYSLCEKESYLSKHLGNSSLGNHYNDILRIQTN